ANNMTARKQLFLFIVLSILGLIITSAILAAVHDFFIAMKTENKIIYGSIFGFCFVSVIFWFALKKSPDDAEEDRPQ
ncbi:MAG: hypothetical protein V4493_05880, partial [Pseudomonadota bacterium]